MATYACSECGVRQEGPGECPEGHGPLLDLSDDEIRVMLVEEEDRQAMRRTQKMVAVAMPLGLGTLWMLEYIPGFTKIVNFVPFVPFAGLIIWAICLTALWLFILGKAFPFKRHFADL
ncbi:MAG: hypothetical protein ACE366_26945 [Bradymonadia bacterium]